MREHLHAVYPLSETYEYAAELGLVLVERRADVREAVRAAGLDELRLAQARGYAALVEAEAMFVEAELVDELATIIASSPEFMRQALVADAAANVDHESVPMLPAPAPLAGEEVLLVVRPESAHSLGGFGDTWRWTLDALQGANVEVVEPRLATISELARVHDERYLVELNAFAFRGGGYLTPDTLVERTTPLEIHAAAGSLLTATARALAGERRLQLCFARPGSHHAFPSRAGGTCVVNNLAVAAAHARLAGISRVAILDVDAHHGNGTEGCFLSDPSVMTVSVHQANPFYPGTGAADERGHGAGEGANLNLPVASGESWAAALEQALDAIAVFEPELVLVELSTDAHAADPVSALDGSDDDFSALGRALGELDAPVVCELGSSLSERAWQGGLRAVIRGFAAVRG